MFLIVLGAVILFVILGFLLAYYFIVLDDLNKGKYKTRREFLLDLIPFRSWASTLNLINQFTKLR